MKKRNNPMQLLVARRCGVRTRSGPACKAPAVNGRNRCRMHGGKSPGAPKGNKNAWRHGRYSREAIERRRATRSLIAEMRETITELLKVED